MPADDKMLLIRNYDLWCHLSDQDYKDLNIEHHYIEVPKGEYIYFEAYNHNKIYFVKEGYIRIGYIDADGNEKVKEIIQKGELFGQFTLERDNLHGEFAQAYKQDVSICAFHIDDFEKLLKKKPDLALRYSKQVGAKLRSIRAKLVERHRDGDDGTRCDLDVGSRDREFQFLGIVEGLDGAADDRTKIGAGPICLQKEIVGSAECQ